MKYATRNKTKNKNFEAENRQQHSLFAVLLLGLLDHADGGHTAQPLFERAERRALRQQHEQPVERAHQWRVLVRVEQLQSQEGKDRGLKELDQLVDLLKRARRDLDVGEFLHEVGRVFVVL